MIIDIHAHIWGGDMLEKTKENVREGLRRGNLDRVYISALKSYMSDAEEVTYLNDCTYAFMQEDPEHIGGAVYVNPALSNTMDEIKKACEERGFEMIKLWVATYADEPCVDPVMEYAQANGLPVLFHAFHKAFGQVAHETTGIHMANIARRHPKTKILMAHFGGNAYNGIPAIRDLPNVWCDQSGTIYNGDTLNYAVENLGAERILFGTDNATIVNIGQVYGADLTEEQRELIFYKNALKLLDRNFRL